MSINNIKNNNFINDFSNDSYKKNLIKNTGCCGAVSEAWVPSYPSLPISINMSLNNTQSSSSLSDKSDSSSLLSHNSNIFLRRFNSLTEREDK